MIVLSLINPSRPEFEDAVHKILKHPEYKGLKLGVQDYIQMIKEYIATGLMNILKKIFSNIATAGSISETLSTIFIIIGLLAIITIVILIVVKFSKTFESKSRIKEILGEKIDDRTTPNSLRLKAEGFAKVEDYRQAIRFDFIALLLLMHEKNLLYLDETKTNEEIYNYLKKNNFSQLVLFKCLINDFNASWYGHKVWNSELYLIWKNNIGLIWNEVIHH
ncbi:MAG: hypothetical protein H7Y18_08425 [Clostridiaceae bacterium]|nr:hypothetical protein [Clostridiaceae bacterium]